MMKKLFIVMAVVLALCVFSVSFAKSKFPDTVDTKYDTAVEKLTSMEVITGFPDGTFKPEEAVTRAQMAKMLVEGLKLKNVNEIALFQFSDLTKDHWGYKWIKTAVDNNLVVGYPDGTFKPDATVTYAEAMTMILRALKLEAQMKDKTWPAGYMKEASSQGLLKDVTYSESNAPADRGEVSISLYNMVVKVEKQKAEEEAAKKAAQEEAEKQAKKNALDFGIVDSTASAKSGYTLKLAGDKNKYDIDAIDGKTKLTSTKVEALKGNVIGFKDTDDGLDILATYTPSDFYNANLITKIESNTITFKDKTTWDVSKQTFKDTYAVYNFIRITGDVEEKDDDEVLVFDDVDKLGVGLSKVKFVKGERVLIDTDNKVVIFLKGISEDATISKKGVVEGSTVDTDDYLYGWVVSTNTKNKIDYAKIGKTTYEVYTKSKSFDEDTYAVYEIYEEDEDYDLIKLVKSFGVKDLDANAKIVSAVSGTKAGSQKITYKGDSSATDYYTSANLKKYKYYQVIEVEVSEKSKELYVDDYLVLDSIEDIEFAKGDRVIIDKNTEVFIVFHGLKSTSTYKSGKYSTTTDDDDEEETTVTKYTVTFKWKDATNVPTGAKLPTNQSITKGNKVTYEMPTAEGYTFTADVASGTVINKATTITITYTKSSDPAKDKVEQALAAKEKAEKELADAKKALEDAEKALATCEKNITDFDKKNNYNPDTIDSKISAAESDVTSAKSALADAKATQSSCQTAYDEAEAAKIAAKEAYDEAESGDEKEALKDAYTDACIALDDAKDDLDDANAAVKEAQAYVTAKEKIVSNLKNLKQQRALLDKAKTEAEKKVTSAQATVTAKEKALEAAEKAYDDAVKEMLGN